MKHGLGRQGQSFPRRGLTPGLSTLQRGRTLVSPAAGSPWGFLASSSGHIHHTHCCPGFSAPRTLYPFPVCQPTSQLSLMPLFPQTAATVVLGVGGLYYCSSHMQVPGAAFSTTPHAPQCQVPGEVRAGVPMPQDYLRLGFSGGSSGAQGRGPVLHAGSFPSSGFQGVACAAGAGPRELLASPPPCGSAGCSRLSTPVADL